MQQFFLAIGTVGILSRIQENLVKITRAMLASSLGVEEEARLERHIY